jgi:imidazolonepropionase-like amidohydrolase
MLRLLQPGLFLIALVYPITIAVQQPTVIRAARMLDVVKGEMIAPAMVVVADGKIRSVGSRDVPAGATTFDLGDVTLLPGLIDAHTHLTFDISGDWVTRSVRELPADAALRGREMRASPCSPDSRPCAMSARPGLPMSP